MVESLLKLLEQVSKVIATIVCFLQKHQGPSVPIEVFEPKEEEKVEKVEEKPE